MEQKGKEVEEKRKEIEQKRRETEQKRNSALCGICATPIPSGHYSNHLAVHMALSWKNIQKSGQGHSECAYCQKGGDRFREQ